MREHSAESLKSFERFNRAWIEEAQTLSECSFELLRPTIRAEGSEIWAGWNPRRKDDMQPRSKARTLRDCCIRLPSKTASEMLLLIRYSRCERSGI
jgi:hypothetical protein